MTKIEEFFARYEEGANSFDPDLVTSEFASSFMGGDPNGVACVQNDDAFRKAIPQRRAFFQQIGFRLPRYWVWWKRRLINGTRWQRSTGA